LKVLSKDNSKDVVVLSFSVLNEVVPMAMVKLLFGLEVGFGSYY
jgi:hypothetical protein